MCISECSRLLKIIYIYIHTYILYILLLVDRVVICIIINYNLSFYVTDQSNNMWDVLSSMEDLLITDLSYECVIDLSLQ